MAKPKLLSYCKANNRNLIKEIPRLQHVLKPADRCTSRLKFRPDVFEFSLVSESIEELVECPPLGLSFSECCDKRALALEKLNKDTYYILYSGGIDSTCMLTSFLRNWRPENLKKVKLLLSTDSILENPDFYQNWLFDFEQMSSLSNYWTDLDDRKLLLSGDNGDQLFGSDYLGSGVQFLGEDSICGDYRVYVPKIFSAVYKSESAGKSIFEHFHPMVDECPFPIRTSHDFLWWYNFTQKWQYVKFRLLGLSDCPERIQYGDHVQSFFDTWEFQKWSLENHDLKIRKTWVSYKNPAKEYIYSFTKNRSDLLLTKRQSLKNLFHFVGFKWAISETYKSIDSIEEILQYVR